MIKALETLRFRKRPLFAVSAIMLFLISTGIAFTQAPHQYLQPENDTLISKFLVPIKRNRFRRTPKDNYPHARIFGLPDASRLWLATIWLATKRYVLSSEDRGLSWKPTHLPDDHGGIIQQNHNAWYWVSRSGRVFFSKDEGITWSTSALPPETTASTVEPAGFNLGSIAFSRNGKYGVAVGGDGFFIQTATYAGTSWQLVSGAPNPLRKRRKKGGVYRQLLTSAALSDDSLPDTF